MMSKDPDQRPTAQQLLAHPLHRYYRYYNTQRSALSLSSGFLPSPANSQSLRYLVVFINSRLSWYNYVRDKGSSIVSGFWDKLTPVQAPRPGKF